MRFRLFAVASFSFSTSLLLASLSGCGRSEIGDAPAQTGQAALEERAEEAQSSVKGVRELTVSGGKLEGADEQGRPLWRLEAKKIQSNGPTNDKSGLPSRATLFDARATLFRGGKPETTFAAKQMTLFDTPGGVRLAMVGGVNARSAGLASGNRGAVEIKSQRADVDVEKRVVAASGAVTATHQKTILKAARLRSQTALEALNLNGDVSVATPDARVQAQSALFHWKNNRLSAQQVTATRADVALRGQKLEADLNASRGTLSGNVTATSGDGNARAPRLDFNWEADRITAPDAVLTRGDATLRAASLRTDSKLRASSAQGVTLSRGNATLRAASAQGFEGLSRLSAQGVTLSRGDLQVEAARADARDWSQAGGVITASGGVSVRAPRGTLRAPQATVYGENRVVAKGGVRVQTGELTASAPSATWTRGGRGNGTVEASGGIEMRGRGAVLRAQSGTSNADFQSATLRGNVHATLADGSVMRAPTLQKNGNLLVAPNATASLSTRGAGTVNLSAARLESRVDGSRATASGGVTLRSAQGATIKAPRAEYFKATNQIVATGGVTFSDPKRGLTQRGDTLRADLKTNSFVVDNVRGQGSGQIFDGAKLFE